MKNIILGIDGGSFEQILPLIKQNKLPNISRMIQKGFYSNLKVTVPPVTVPSWPCIFSGLTVEDLGKCTFYDPTFGVFSSKYWKEKSIFSFEQITQFCLNVPSTYPAWKINGEMICGMLTPEINEKMVYPERNLEHMKNDWIIDGDSIANTFKAFDIKSSLFKRKLDEDFQLYTYVIRLPDCITHHPYITISSTELQIKNAYIKIDKFIGELMNRGDIDNIFLISDHGLKKYKHDFNIVRFLEKKNVFIRPKDKISKFMSIIMKLFGVFNPNFFDTTYFHNKFKKMMEKGFKRKNVKSLSTSKNLRLVHFYSNYGGIYIPKSYRRIKSYINKNLIQNKKVLKTYLYDLKSLPDIIVKLNDGYLFSLKETYFLQNLSDSYNHSDKGIFIAFGKNISNNHKKIVAYTDIVPTILRLYNIKKPDHMKGNPLEIIKNN